MRVPKPKLPALFTRSPYIESTEGDDIDEGFASRRALFTDAAYETDLTEDVATKIIDPGGRDMTSILSGICPDQDVDYILLADAKRKTTPYEHTAYASSTKAIDTCTRYAKNVADAYICLNHLIAASTAATVAPKALDPTDTLISSAMQTILRQLDKTILDATQLMRENTILRATIARYEQENEELEDKNRMLIKIYNAERRLCGCAGQDESAYSENGIQRYGEGRFVKDRLHSWEGEAYGVV